MDLDAVKYGEYGGHDGDLGEKGKGKGEGGGEGEGEEGEGEEGERERQRERPTMLETIRRTRSYHHIMVHKQTHARLETTLQATRLSCGIESPLLT